MSKYKHQLSGEVLGGWEAYGYSNWRPVIAIPFFVGFRLKKAKCECGRVFKNQEEFEAHYLYRSVWKGESTFQPIIWKELTR